MEIDFDHIYSLKQKVDFHFSQSPRNVDEILLEIGFMHSVSDFIVLSKTELLSKRFILGQLLDRFTQSRSMDDLYELALQGYSVFTLLDEQLKKQNRLFHQRIWRDSILNKIDTKNYNKISKPNRILEVTFPADFSLCIGLIFPTKPSVEKWKKYSQEEILGHFFDFRFKIINRINPSQFAGIYMPSQTLTAGDKINAINVFDSKLHISKLETESLKFSSIINSIKVDSVTQLIKEWNRTQPQYFLFSTHYSQDTENLFKFHLTNDVFTSHDLIKIQHKEGDPKALMFLNCCKTGDLPISGFANVLTKFYPKYSLGFVTTGYDLASHDAGHFPNMFNKIFFQENIMILDAFVKTKNYLVFQSLPSQYSALGYMLWQVNPDLTFTDIIVVNKKAKIKNAKFKQKRGKNPDNRKKL